MSLSSLGKSLQDSSRQKIEWVPGTGGDALAGFFPELLFIAGLRLMMVKVPYRPTSQNATNSRSGERLIHVACTIRERFGVPQKAKPATFSIPLQR